MLKGWYRKKSLKFCLNMVSSNEHVNIPVHIKSLQEIQTSSQELKSILEEDEVLCYQEMSGISAIKINLLFWEVWHAATNVEGYMYIWKKSHKRLTCMFKLKILLTNCLKLIRETIREFEIRSPITVVERWPL